MNNQMYLEIGSRIRQRREYFRLSREQLAEKMSISVRFLTDIELGIKGMSIPTLMNFCKVLSVSSDYLLFGEKSENGSLIGLIENLNDEQAKYSEELLKTFIGILNSVSDKNNCCDE